MLPLEAAPDDTPAAHKRCRRCGETKPLARFYKRSGARIGVRSWCRPCYSAMKPPLSPEARHWQSASASLRGRGGTLTAAQLRDGLGVPRSCYLCGAAGLTWETAALDHVLPVARGGDHALGNLRWAHRRCNWLKGGFSLTEFCALASSIIAIHGEG